MSTATQPQTPPPTSNAPEGTTGGNPTTQPHSTPAAKKFTSYRKHASHDIKNDKVRAQLASEMQGRWAGPMPVRQFLDSYFDSEVVAAIPTPFNDHFGRVCDATDESKRYTPFIDAIAGWTPGFLPVNTGNTTDYATGLKPDISLYKLRTDGEVPNRPDFTQLELWLEFKKANSDDPFVDPSDFDPHNCDDHTYRQQRENNAFTPQTQAAQNVRGQLTAYAGAHHGHQFRNFSFSILIAGETARFLRWDPAGTAVTQSFNFRKQPELMAEFFWKFSHASAAGRGHDTTVRPADLTDDVAQHVRKQLNLKADVPLFEYDMPGLTQEGHCYGPRPPNPTQSLASRCSRTLHVLYRSKRCAEQGLAIDGSVSDAWVGERHAFLKDTWRFLPDDPSATVLAEHEIYEKLHEAGVTHIPDRDLIIGGDLPNGETRTQELVKQPWLCATLRVTHFQHYRLVLGVVGRELTTFTSTKELVTAVRDAIEAHCQALLLAALLHRDISVGNIIIYNGRGLLIDWEMAKDVDALGARRHDRTGTWQFMSAALLEDVGKKHDLTDDLESFLHVLAWTVLRYLPAVDGYAIQQRRIDLDIFDECKPLLSSVTGGIAKADKLGRGVYPPTKFRPSKPTPLHALIRTLASPFRSFYSADHPTEEERAKFKDMPNPPSTADEASIARWAAVRQFDREMGHLQSSEWFIKTIEDALATNEWPSDDRADHTVFTQALDGEVAPRKSRGSQYQSQKSKGALGSNKRPLDKLEEEPPSKRLRSRP